MRVLIVMCLAITVLGLMIECVFATVLNVPDDYPTIQDALDVATEGDSVQVAPGIYSGPGFYQMTFLGKAVVLISEAGPGSTIIDLRDDGWRTAFYFTDGEPRDAVVEGFTVTGCYVYEGCGGALQCEGSSPTIKNCLFAGNEAWGTIAADGGAVCCRQEASPLFENCTFASNAARLHEARGGGIYCTSGSAPEFLRCILWHNEGGDVSLSSSASASFSCCAVDSSGLFGEGSYQLDADCLFENPLLCNPADAGRFSAHPDDYALDAQSPCLEWNSPCGERIGAFGVGCPASLAEDSDMSYSIALPWIRVEPPIVTRYLRARLNLVASSHVWGRIIDSQGRMMVSIVDGELARGEHAIRVDLRAQRGLVWHSGIYHLLLSVGGRHMSGRFIILE